MFDPDEILQQQEEEARLKQVKQRQRIDDVCWLMSHTRGRRFLWDLLDKTHFERPGETIFRTHGGQQSYLLGAYEVGRALADEIRNLCPEQYLLMVRENTPKPDEVSP